MLIYSKRKLQGNEAAALLITDASIWQKRHWLKPTGPFIVPADKCFPHHDVSSTIMENLDFALKFTHFLFSETLIKSIWWGVLVKHDAQHFNSLISISFLLCRLSLHNYFNLELIRCLQSNSLLISYRWSYLTLYTLETKPNCFSDLYVCISLFT